MAEEHQPEEGPYTRWVQSTIRNPQKAYRAMFYVAAVFFIITTLFPFYWLLVLALTPLDRIVDMGLVPKGFNPGAFVEMFQLLPFHRYMFNSIVIGLATTVVVLLVGSFAGYAFGRLEFRGRTGLLLLLLAISYFPPAAFILPLFNFFTGNVSVFGVSSPSWFNTPGALVTPFSGLYMPLTVFILTTFYSQIPDGLEDAARVEGSTRIGALFRIIIPLSAPGVATAGVLTFIQVYNEFFFSFLMTDGQPQHWAPIVWGILNYQGQFQAFYNLMAAASIVGVLPVAILVVVAQERIVSGLTAGALKE
ncbi:carbohydrate ABC transporter permease [Haladaptatus salinisoli]|uniref:carbohydrate ABC transporter permease n=1 Tax=Haladaptatus salinisoli TaxID=2884876 RepID=UPI001D09F260|nr:carbohydrate ABC transporter permease [Haladaptatus salinisoli]